MFDRKRLIGTVVGLLTLVLVPGAARSLFATTVTKQLQDSSGEIVGTLQYTVNETSGSCPITYSPPLQYGSYYIWNFSNFSFAETKGPGTGATFGLTGGGTYVQSPGGSSCPAPGATPSSQVTLGGGYGFSIQFSLCGGDNCSATMGDIPAGYISPKYVIESEVYAPPGPQSLVTYGGSVSTGNTTSVSSSFTSSTTVTESVTNAFSIMTPFHAGNIGLGGKSTNTSTESSSQSQGSSETFTTDLKDSANFTTPGGPITWEGWFTSGFNPHNADWAWLWLNPVLPFEAPTTSSAIWLGYGYDACDPAVGLDLYNILNGSLENDGGGTTTFRALSMADKNELARAWAADPSTYVGEGEVPSDCVGQSFGSNGSAKLQETDYQAILSADPLLNEQYQLNLQSPSYTTTGDGRYTRSPAFISPGTQQVVTTNTDFPFVQAACAGCNPPSESYSAEYTASTQVGSSTGYTNAQTFGVDKTFSSSLWLVNITNTLSTSYTLKSDYETKTNITKTMSNYGSFTVVGPPCDNASGSTTCRNYSGPAEFDVYQDNKFGTFMFWPIQ